MRDMPDAKIAVPELPPDHVARPRLLTELSAARDIALVCAPAGYGKTFLLAEWARAHRHAGTAWVSLDAYDNDPRRLWSGVTRALARCPAVPTSSQLRCFRRWPTDGQPEFLGHLMAAASALPRPVALILDDVHELEASEARQGLQTFLRNRPRTLTVLLVSRYDLALGLHRLRLAERVTQLRLDQLRFTAAEAQALLAATGLRLTPAEVDILLQRTGGWAAGLRLAAVALARVPNVEEFLKDFSGDDHSVADYLYAEVLSTLSEDTLELLRATSVSDPVPVELAAELSGREDAGDVLARLERRTDMVKAVDRGRHAYRVQPLVRGYLVADLSRHGQRRVAQMHADAARWWARENHPRNALDHAAHSGDHELLAGMLRRFSLPLLLSGDHDALRGSLSARGSEALHDDPWAALLSALLHHENGELAAAKRDARIAVRCWPGEPDEDLGLLRMAAAGLGLLDDDECYPGPIPIGSGPASAALAGMIRSLTQLRERRNVPAARELLSDTLALAQEYGFDYLALQCLALSGVAAATDGDLRAMRAAGAEAVEFADRHGWRHSPAGLIGSALAAYGALLAADPDNAEKMVTQVVESADTSAPRTRFALHWIRAAAAADRGQLIDSLADMQRARAVLGDRTVSPVEAVAPAVLEFEAAARPGHLAAARGVHSWMVERVGETAESTLMSAREQEAMGRYPPARTLVNAVLDEESEAVLPHTMVDAWLRSAALAAAADDRLSARRALDNALLIAEPLDALRPFAEARPTVRELLAQWHSGTEVVHEFARRALAAGRARNRLATMLSERELTVLSMLPSLLSLEDIARDLIISVNTVKSHVRAVYRKLGVSSRRAAVLAAHEHGLIGGRRPA